MRYAKVQMMHELLSDIIDKFGMDSKQAERMRVITLAVTSMIWAGDQLAALIDSNIDWDTEEEEIQAEDALALWEIARK